MASLASTPIQNTPIAHFDRLLERHGKQLAELQQVIDQLSAFRTRLLGPWPESPSKSPGAIAVQHPAILSAFNGQLDNCDELLSVIRGHLAALSDL